MSSHFDRPSDPSDTNWRQQIAGQEARLKKVGARVPVRSSNENINAPIPEEGWAAKTAEQDALLAQKMGDPAEIDRTLAGSKEALRKHEVRINEEERARIKTLRANMHLPGQGLGQGMQDAA